MQKGGLKGLLRKYGEVSKMILPEKHFKATAKLVRALDKYEVAHWLLNDGYYPEQYVLPPSFSVLNFEALQVSEWVKTSHELTIT